MEEEDDFVSMHDKAFTLLNVAKTKGRSIDFRRLSSPAAMTVNKGEEIELVNHNKYVGPVLDKTQF